jgi:hypothetical protein
MTVPAHTKAATFQVNYHVEVPVEHKALTFCSMFLIGPPPTG